MESLKRIAVIANLSLDMSELTRREKITAAQISNNGIISWDANFAMLVEYVGENFKLPDQRKSKLGKWYNGKTIYHCQVSSHAGYEGDSINLV